jgi:hypothetical protein
MYFHASYTLSTAILRWCDRARKYKWKLRQKYNLETERDIEWQTWQKNDNERQNFEIYHFSVSRCHFFVTFVILCLSLSLNFISVSIFICTFLPRRWCRLSTDNWISLILSLQKQDTLNVTVGKQKMALKFHTDVGDEEFHKTLDSDHCWSIFEMGCPNNCTVP